MTSIEKRWITIIDLSFIIFIYKILIHNKNKKTKIVQATQVQQIIFYVVWNLQFLLYKLILVLPSLSFLFLKYLLEPKKPYTNLFFYKQYKPKYKDKNKK